MARLLVWGGPVSRAQLPFTPPSDVTVLTVNQGVPDAPGGNTIGSNAFKNLALSLVDGQGRILPTLCSRSGLDESAFESVAISGFSAFHGLANEMLARDGDRIDACVCLDACFSAFGQLEKPGFVSFGQRAAAREKLFVLSASYGGGSTYSTGSACVIANVEASSGSLVEGSVPQLDPAPVVVYRDGGLFALDYQGSYQHGQHVSVLGRTILETFLSRWWADRTYPTFCTLDGACEESGSEASGSGGGTVIARATRYGAFLAGGALLLGGGFVVAKSIDRSRRSRSGNGAE